LRKEALHEHHPDLGAGIPDHTVGGRRSEPFLKELYVLVAGQRKRLLLQDGTEPLSGHSKRGAGRVERGIGQSEDVMMKTWCGATRL